MVLQVRQEGTPLFAALTSRTSLLEERSGGADLDALATACAARGLAPGSPHVGHEPHVDPRAHQAPGMRTLDLVADAHAAQARDAAVVVDREKGVTGVDADHGADERQLEVVYLQLLGQVLQIAMIVGDADSADVVALEEQHLNDRPAVPGELLGGGSDVHSLGDERGARRRELVRTRDLDHAQAARAGIGEPIEVTHRRDVDAVLHGNSEDRLAIGPGNVDTVDPQGVDRGHTGTGAGSIAHTPAGQTRSTIWARYSSRK